MPQSKSPDPKSLRPGELVVVEGGPERPRHDGAVVLRRHLLGASGKRVCDVHERTCSSQAEADRYVAEFGPSEKCPPPWGTGDPVPSRWSKASA